MNLNKSFWSVMTALNLLVWPIFSLHAASPWNCQPDTNGQWTCTENQTYQPSSEPAVSPTRDKPYSIYAIPSDEETDEKEKPPVKQQAEADVADEQQEVVEPVQTEKPEQNVVSEQAPEPEKDTAQTPTVRAVEPPAEAPAKELEPAKKLEKESPAETTASEQPTVNVEESAQPEPAASQAEPATSDVREDVTKPAENSPTATTQAPSEPASTTDELQTVQQADAPVQQISPGEGIDPQGGIDWNLCGNDASRRPAAPVSTNGQVEINADQVQIRENDVSVFEGNVHVRRDNQSLSSDHMTYNKQNDQVDARSNVVYSKDGVTIESDTATFNIATDQGRFDQAGFKLAQRHARGTADVIEQEGPAVTRLDKATYTTCNPGNNDWNLKADKITLDQVSGRGVGRNVSLRFKGVPFFYTPYISFPIDNRRKSGFLAPSFGDSTEGGAELTVPYYWNIAPDKDATLTLRHMSERGALYKGEFRYLTQRHNGQIDLEHLPDDDVFNDDRTLFAFKHSGSLAPRLNMGVDFRYASDSDYLTDFGDSLSFSSITHLERTAHLSYTADAWSVTGRVQSFQTIDQTIVGTSRPYQRLPQIVFNGSWPERAMGLTYDLGAELVNFDRDAGVIGTRLDLRPSVSLPIERLGGYLTPKLTLQHTRYDLDNQGAGLDDAPDRTSPIFSLDGGLFFEREVTAGSDSYLHTLEPRLFYVNIPHEDQTDIPVFDTAINTFSVAELFREDRFNGPDRVGDTNQLTLAVTTRLLNNNTGKEAINATIGQIYYFEDRTVTLPGNSAQTDDSSDIIAAITAYPTDHWSTGADVQWDTQREETERANFYLRYKTDRKHVLNLGYRYQETSLEQLDLNGFWALNPKWNVIGRYLYSLEDEEPLEYLAGLEYQSCCWRLQFLTRSIANDGVNQDDNQVFMIRLELKGLTGFGDEIDNVLERGILGYEREL